MDFDDEQPPDDDAEDGYVEKAMVPPLLPEQDVINTQANNIYIKVFPICPTCNQCTVDFKHFSVRLLLVKTRQSLYTWYI